MSAKFGTSGLRGLVGELVDGTAARHVGAFAAFLLASGRSASGERLFMGRDLRASSPLILEQCMAAVAVKGLVPVDCGEVPTPALALYAMQHGSGSVMVTGSHIPADRNGVKFYRPDGEIDKSDEMDIATRAAEEPRLSYDRPVSARNDIRAELMADYANRYIGMLGHQALSGLKIGVYEHSTVLRDVLGDVLESAGATVVRLGRSTAFIPVDTEAVSDEVQAQIREWTHVHGLDALASADGDGDRPLLADETGTCLRGDLLGLLTARLLEADAVVTPITSNSGIEIQLAARVWRTRVGSPFVIEAMSAARKAGFGRIIGFEANGGVLTASAFQFGEAYLAPLPTRDSMLPILATLGAARRAGVSLSRLADSFDLPVAASGLIRALPTQTSQALIARLTNDSAERVAFCEPFGQVASLDLTDGLRMCFLDGTILHLRPSGNAPEMRVYVEAEDAPGSAKLVQGGIERVLAWTAAA
jgi:phosphomannomutase